YLDRVCISTASVAIKRDLGLSDAQLGYVFSAFTLSYALFEVPGGWLADRFGPRLMLTRIVVWWSAMTAATGVGLNRWGSWNAPHFSVAVCYLLAAACWPGIDAGRPIPASTG